MSAAFMQEDLHAVLVVLKERWTLNIKVKGWNCFCDNKDSFLCILVRAVYNLNLATIIKRQRSFLKSNSRQSNFHSSLEFIKVKSFLTSNEWRSFKAFHWYTLADGDSRILIMRNAILAVKRLFLGSSPIEINVSAPVYQLNCSQYCATWLCAVAARIGVLSGAGNIHVSSSRMLKT